MSESESPTYGRRSSLQWWKQAVSECQSTVLQHWLLFQKALKLACKESYQKCDGRQSWHARRVTRNVTIVKSGIQSVKNAPLHFWGITLVSTNRQKWIKFCFFLILWSILHNVVAYRCSLWSFSHPYKYFRVGWTFLIIIGIAVRYIRSSSWTATLN